MSLPDWVKGSRHTGLRLQWLRRDGSYPDLTSTTITGKMRVLNSSATGTALTGTLAPDGTSPTLGYFTYAPSVLDVGTAGTFQIQFTATFSDAKPDLTFLTEWLITEAM